MTEQPPFNSVETFIQEYYRRNPDGHYFDPEMLKYFGEDKALMRVIIRFERAIAEHIRGQHHRPVYVLVRPPKVKYQVETWDCVLFDVETFRPITSEFTPVTERQGSIQNAVKHEIWLS